MTTAAAKRPTARKAPAKKTPTKRAPRVKTVKTPEPVVTRVVVNASQFASAVRTISKFASKDDTLPTINGVRIEKVGDQLTVFATDRFAMGVETMSIPGGDGPDFAATISLKDVAILLLALKGQRDLVVIEPNENTVTIKGIPFEVVTGHFPNWRKVLKDNATREVEGANEPSFNPDLIRPFLGLYSSGLQVKFTGGNRPLIAVVPGRFIGLAMPVMPKGDAIGDMLKAIEVAA